MDIQNKGSIAETGFIKILLQVYESKLTGMIRAEDGQIIKVVYVHDGTISFASSNEASDRLTEVLMRAGKLTPELVEDATARLKPNVSLGKTLVELGYISARDLLWGARAQVEGILHQLLFWKTGSYQILTGNLPKEIIHLNLSIPNVIYDGIMNCQDRQWILSYIVSPEAVYGIHPDFGELNQLWKLPVQELADQLNGRRTLLEIAHVSGRNTFETCKSVVALEVLGCAQRSAQPPAQMTLDVPPPAETFEEDQAGIPEKQAEEQSSTLKSDPHKLEPNPESDLPLGQVVQIPTVEELMEQKEEVVTALPEDAEESSIEGDTPAPIQNVSGSQEAQTSMEMNSSEEPEAMSDSPVLYEEVSPVRWKYYAPLIFLILAIASYFYLFHSSEPVSPAPKVEQGPGSAPEMVDHSPPRFGNSTETPEEVDPDAEDSESASRDELPVEDLPLSMQLVRKGNYPGAAQLWRTELSLEKSRVTIQLMIACEDKSVGEAFEMLGYASEALIVPMKFKNRSCYRILYGLYPSGSDAQSAISTLPAAFLQQASPPAIVPVSRILE